MMVVVPKSWYDDGVTYWPNYKNANRLQRAVMNAEDPGLDWEMHDVRLLKSTSKHFQKYIFLSKLWL